MSPTNKYDKAFRVFNFLNNGEVKFIKKAPFEGNLI